LAYRDIQQPENFEQRCELAARMKDEFEMPMDVLVDTMEDHSRQIFSDLPSPVYVMDSKGVVRAKFAWPDQEQIKSAVASILADKLLETEALGPSSSMVSPQIPERLRLPAPVVE